MAIGASEYHKVREMLKFQTFSANINFFYFDQKIASEKTYLDPEGFTTLFNVPVGAEHQYLNQPTAMDAIVQLLKKSGVLVYSPIYWDTLTVPHGAYINSFFGGDIKVLASHYTGIPGQSYWKGNAWLPYVNGKKAETYFSNILLSEVNDITLSYEYYEVHW